MLAVDIIALVIKSVQSKQVCKLAFHIKILAFNVIYRFFSIARSTRAIFKFQKLRSLLEIAQNILMVHPFDK